MSETEESVQMSEESQSQEVQPQKVQPVENDTVLLRRYISFLSVNFLNRRTVKNVKESQKKIQRARVLEKNVVVTPVNTVNQDANNNRRTRVRDIADNIKYIRIF